MDFMDSWGLRSGILWRLVVPSGGRVWTLLEVWSDQWLDDFDDSMIRCIEPGLAARMVMFMHFHGIEGSVVFGLIFYGFQMILNGFAWISSIPRGSGVPGLIFNGFHRF